MKLIEGLLNYSDPKPGEIYAFTANSMIHNGKLIMGGGAALAAREAYPDIDLILADEIKTFILDEVYGAVIVPYEDFFVCAFQTKTHVSLPSTVELVETACIELKKLLITKYGIDTPVHLNYPAIGLGGLTPEIVGPIIEPLLFDSIMVYK